jgi:hypothetical protein
MSPESVDETIVAALRRHGLQSSRVMEWAGAMTDVHGPRFANSPGYDAAAAWARDTFAGFGLKNVALEEWGEYGYGWENCYTSAHLLAPRYQPIIAYPVPGTAGTSGKVVAEVTLIDTARTLEESDLEPYRGQLRGRAVLTRPARVLAPNFSPHAVRMSDEELAEMAAADSVVSTPTDAPKPASARQPLASEAVTNFFRDEGVVALLAPGPAYGGGAMDKGTVVVMGDGPLPLGGTPGPATLILAAEHYNRLVRLVERGVEPRVELDVRNTFHDDNPLDYNVIAELPGGDWQDEVVMIGAHLDSEPAGTGATDNAAGSAVVMEAMRLLTAVDAAPRRTIRAALWGAEESGMLGSRGYVERHFGGPATADQLAEHALLNVYFNVDWYGRFRGIFLQGNNAARPIFESWMAPFHDLGMEWIVPGNTGGTDHMAFQSVGLPGFQFIQDDLEFFNVSFHTNMDVYDRLVAEDLQQASVVLASFAYHAAMRAGSFPRADGVNNGLPWHK